MSEVSMISLRDGMKIILGTTMEKVIQNAWVSPTDPTILTKPVELLQLERAIYNSAIRTTRVQPGTPLRQHYATIIHNVIVALEKQDGPFPDNILGLLWYKGNISTDKLIEMSSNNFEPLEPRIIVRNMFVRSLMDANEKYALDRKLTLKIAQSIEISCYNASVRVSKESEEPPRRQWDSLAFIDIYGTRCGTINGLINNKSSVCQAYGSKLVTMLINGDISPDVLGDMTSKELCPQATIIECAEIAKRAVQKVKLKESSLFKCPHCNERRCSYQEVQRRSLDEAPDYLCLCLNCNRRFTGRS